MKLWQVLITYSHGQQIEFFCEKNPQDDFNGLVLPKSFEDSFGRWVRFPSDERPIMVMVQKLDDANACKKAVSKIMMRAQRDAMQEAQNDPLARLTGADGSPLVK